MSIQIQKLDDDNFNNFREGVYKAKVSKIEEKTRINTIKGEEEEGFNITFEFIDGEYAGKYAFKFFTPFLTPKSHLSNVCRGVMGRDFTPAEIASIVSVKDLARYIGEQPVMIVIKTKVSKKGRQYYSINDFIFAGNYAGPNDNLDPGIVSIMPETPQNVTEEIPIPEENPNNPPF